MTEAMKLRKEAADLGINETGRYLVWLESQVSKLREDNDVFGVEMNSARGRDHLNAGTIQRLEEENRHLISQASLLLQMCQTRTQTIARQVAEHECLRLAKELNETRLTAEIDELRRHQDELIVTNNLELEKRRAAERKLAEVRG